MAFSEKLLPHCFWLQGYLKDRIHSHDQYQPLQDGLFWHIELSTRRSSTNDGMSFYGQRVPLCVPEVFQSTKKNIMHN
jgi:hypothetical protein